ncbi:MAG: GTPase ObgE [Erysipelotrichaceae bacterium]|nr:GTPase ObgE [Erysipelotrichaceae bacterium]MCI9312090.1 GTPase ObgE [Erysipelotrichaceae bacterium]
MFIDRVKMNVKAGKGGDGIVAFRHEKYVAYGGPSGGDGGNGGDVIFVADSNQSTLLDLRFHRRVKAEDGGNGKTKKMHGADGRDHIVKVPIGTLIKDVKSGRMLADLTQNDQRAVIAKGGKGGRGNWHFRTSKNTAPQFSETGQAGEDREIEVELKLLADVGLVGFPSVGKSTLLSVVTKAKPEIADYHFTTITPNLGVVQVKDGRNFVMADLPGLIEGASQGKGLGHQFLRHIERCRVIVHVIDMGANDGRDPLRDYEIINAELGQYAYRLLERPQIVVANKMDLDGAKENLVRFQRAYPKVEVFEATTLIAEGLDAVLYRAADLLKTTPTFPLFSDEENQDEGVVYRFEAKEAPFTITKLADHEWEVSGPEIERNFSMKKLSNEEDVMRFARRMRKLNVDEALRNAGCVDGDTVVICQVEFVFED